MSRNKVDNTYHGQDRAAERMNLPKRQRERLIKDASRYGKCWSMLPEGPLQDFVKKKSGYKRVKYFQGYIFIFQKTSTSLITMYPVPEETLTAQKEFNNKVKEGEEDDNSTNDNSREQQHS